MKIYMGPYTRYFGPYDLAELLKYFGVSEQRRCDIGEWLDHSWIGKLLRKLNDINERKIKVRIDHYDTWSMDHTLALIVVPMLKQIKETKDGSPMVDDKDVPNHLRSSNSKKIKENDWDLDEFHHDRWDWVLDEMIWAFEQVIDDDGIIKFFNEKTNKHDGVAYRKHNKRIQNGLILFGKYYQALWD